MTFGIWVSTGICVSQTFYLDVMNDGFELRAPLHPAINQLHSPVEILHILSVHLQERRQLLQDVTDARVLIPEGRGQV